jgi:hypothetical protein
MRRQGSSFSIAPILVVVCLLISPLAFGRDLVPVPRDDDAGVNVGVTTPATAPVETESMPARLGKALAFGVVVSLLLVGGSLWQKRRRRGALPR